MIKKSLSTDTNKVIVTFEIPGAVWAERINLVGDFNDWDRDSLPFRFDRKGNWSIELELDQGREYRFRYLMDGDYWTYDWRADRHTLSVDGCFDSVVVARMQKTA